MAIQTAARRLVLLSLLSSAHVCSGLSLGHVKALTSKVVPTIGLTVPTSFKVASSKKSPLVQPIFDASTTQRCGSLEAATGETAPAENNSLRGALMLVFISFLYGTLGVTARYLYAFDGPPSAAAFSTVRGWMAAACFLPLISKSKSQLKEDPGYTSGKDRKKLWTAAFELGVWNFLAQGLYMFGLQYTESARAAFLTQLSVVFTPIISLIAGQTIKNSTWAGCGCALAGLVLLASSGATAAAPVAASSGVLGMIKGALASVTFSTGDLFVLAGAVSWSMYLFRTSGLGSKFPEVPLQTIKNLLLACLYTSWLGAEAAQAFSTGGMSAVAKIWLGWKNLSAWAIIFFSAVGPGAMADVLQQQAQREVTPSQANIILSAEPIFTAICAYFLLGEVTTMRENIGGSMIIAAALISSA